MLTPLNQLRPGAEIGLDSRRSGQLEGIAELADSIHMKGLLQPPGIWRDEADGALYVVFGNRRLHALRMLVERGDMAADAGIETKLLEGSFAEVLDASISENMDRLPLHPVDLFEDVAQLIREGMTKKDVCARRRLSHADLERVLALGRLAPAVLESWRSGTIDENAAKAFTLLSGDHDAQTALLKKLLKERVGHGMGLPSWAVRQAVVGLGGEVRKLIEFVTEDAYAEAGGRVVSDLFGDEKVYPDVPLLERLAAAKLAEVADQLRADGWGTVVTVFDEDYDPARFNAYKPAGHQAFTPEEAEEHETLDNDEKRKAAGIDFNTAWTRRSEIRETARVRSLDGVRDKCTCIVDVGWHGTFNAKIGWTGPDAEPVTAPPAAAPEAPAAKADGEPQRVIDQLRQQQSRVLAELFHMDTALALDALVATLLCGPHRGSPVIMRVDGLDEVVRHLETKGWNGVRPASFSQAFGIVTAQAQNAKLDLLASLVALAIDTSTSARSSSSAWGKSVKADAIELLFTATRRPQEALTLAREAFDAAAYFDGVKKDHALVAITEALGEDAAKTMRNAKKPALVAYCVEKVAPTGWLPKELRVPAYGVPRETPAVDEKVWRCEVCQDSTSPPDNFAFGDDCPGCSLPIGNPEEFSRHMGAADDEQPGADVNDRVTLDEDVPPGAHPVDHDEREEAAGHSDGDAASRPPNGWNANQKDALRTLHTAGASLDCPHTGLGLSPQTLGSLAKFGMVGKAKSGGKVVYWLTDAGKAEAASLPAPRARKARA